MLDRKSWLAVSDAFHCGNNFIRSNGNNDLLDIRYMTKIKLNTSNIHVITRMKGNRTIKMVQYKRYLKLDHMRADTAAARNSGQTVHNPVAGGDNM